MVDRVRAYKMERPLEGGTQNDENFTEVDVGQDYLDCNGVTLQVSGATTTTADSVVFVNRVATAMQFTDGPSGSLALGQLLTSVSGKPGSHNTTPDIIHWLSDGPGDGFPSGSTRRVVLVGSLPQSETWYTSSALTTKLYSIAYTYTGLLCTTRVQTLYANNVAVRTVTDTISYAQGIFAPIITRTWT